LQWDSDQPRDFAYLMLVTVAITTAAWLAVTLLTAPEPREKLVSFYRRVRPEGPGWKHIASEAGVTETNWSGGLAAQFANWALGCVLIYTSLFGIGKLVFKEWGMGLVCTAAAVAAAMLISWNMVRGGRRGIRPTQQEPEAVERR